MSWCPKCKTEYRAGITVCADCGSDLVDKLEVQCDQCVALFDKEEEANKFKEFLTYSKIKDISVNYDDLQEAYGVFVTEDELEEAKKLFHAFDLSEAKKTQNKDSDEAKEDAAELSSMTDDNEEEDSLKEALEEAFEVTDAEETEHDVEIPLAKVMPKSSVTYVKKEERYNDYRSTFYIFFVFGVLGIVFTILNMVGVIGLFSSWLQYIIIGVVSIAFVVIALFSYNRSKVLFDEIDNEKEITKSIKEWMAENITAEILSQFDNDVDPDEVIFLKKINYIKKCLMDRYTFDNESYVDELIEEFYTENFE